VYTKIFYEFSASLSSTTYKEVSFNVTVLALPKNIKCLAGDKTTKISNKNRLNELSRRRRMQTIVSQEVLLVF
jgi:hypothetical protein